MNKSTHNLTLLTLTLLLPLSLSAMEPHDPAKKKLTTTQACAISMQELFKKYRSKPEKRDSDEGEDSDMHDVDEKENEDDASMAFETPETLGIKLIDAIRQNKKAIAKKLIEQKANVNYRNPYIPLPGPIEECENDKIIIQFVAHDPKPNARIERMFYLHFKHNCSDWTPLMRALANPRVGSLVPLLINAKAEVNIHAAGGSSALHILRDRSRDVKRSIGKTNALTHALVMAGARLYTSQEKQALRITPFLRHDESQLRDSKYDSVFYSAIVEAAQQRTQDQLIFHLLLKNPGSRSWTPKNRKRKPADDDTPEQPILSCTNYMLPTSTLVYINSFLTNARFDLPSWANAAMVDTHDLQQDAL